MKANLSLLCVDDDPDILDLLASFFADSVDYIDTAVNGRDALDKLSQGQVDVVITDVRMPVMDGYELLKKLREKHAMAPCVLITSGYMDHAVESLYDLGANGFFPKPFSATAVLKAMRQAIIPPQERWSSPDIEDPAHFLQLRLQSTFQDSSQIRFGNGGFSALGTELAQARAGEALAFDLNFADLHLKGTGFIRWVTRLNKPDMKTDFGVEIQSLEEPARSSLASWIASQKQAAFIPKS